MSRLAQGHGQGQHAGRQSGRQAAATHTTHTTHNTHNKSQQQQQPGPVLARARDRASMHACRQAGSSTNTKKQPKNKTYSKNITKQ